MQKLLHPSILDNFEKSGDLDHDNGVYPTINLKFLGVEKKSNGEMWDWIEYERDEDLFEFILRYS
jgi:hypothetical protein